LTTSALKKIAVKRGRIKDVATFLVSPIRACRRIIMENIKKNDDDDESLITLEIPSNTNYMEKDYCDLKAKKGQCSGNCTQCP
jgi:hypothetical protein